MKHLIQTMRPLQIGDELKDSRDVYLRLVQSFKLNVDAANDCVQA